MNVLMYPHLAHSQVSIISGNELHNNVRSDVSADLAHPQSFRSEQLAVYDFSFEEKCVRECVEQVQSAASADAARAEIAAALAAADAADAADAAASISPARPYGVIASERIQSEEDALDAVLGGASGFGEAGGAAAAAAEDDNDDDEEDAFDLLQENQEMIVSLHGLVTGHCTDAECKSLLQACGWNIGAASNALLDNGCDIRTAIIKKGGKLPPSPPALGPGLASADSQSDQKDAERSDSDLASRSIVVTVCLPDGSEQEHKFRLGDKLIRVHEFTQQHAEKFHFRPFHLVRRKPKKLVFSPAALQQTLSEHFGSSINAIQLHVRLVADLA
jgi:UBA-like domain